MNRLPVPDEGWKHLLRQAALIATLWAIVGFGIAAVALPMMDPQCYSDSPTGGRVCPLHSDPAITQLFDVRWPPVPGAFGVPVIVLSLLAGIGLAVFLDTSEPWSESGGAPTVVGGIAGLFGTGAGLFIAGPGFVHPLIAVGVTGLGALLILLGMLAARGFRRALGRSHARYLRREQLREHGTRTVATITALDWRHRYWDDDPVFSVTARLGSARDARTITEDLCVPREQAPVVGGTVLVIHDEQDGHETGIDVLVESDPHGLRDPDALSKYPEAPSPS